LPHALRASLSGAVDIAAGRRYNTGMIRKRDSSLKIVFFLIFVFTFISCAKESKHIRPIKVACVGDSITFGAGLEDWRKDYGDLVDTFINLPSHPKVFICKPIPTFAKDYTISDSVIRNEIIPIIGKVGKVKKVEVIDLYKVFSGKEKLFLDGIHLNEEGCAFMAKEIYKAMTGKEVLDKEAATRKN
jgi:lysophospholipase L1-like esterase